MKTYRIGMIGSENSHARAFAKAFCKEPGFADMQVTAVYGDEGIEKSQRVQEFFPDAVIVETPEQMLGLVDAVMITSRDGVLHYPYVDGKNVWFGNIDFLAFGRKDADVLRFIDPDTAGELVEPLQEICEKQIMIEDEK